MLAAVPRCLDTPYARSTRVCSFVQLCIAGGEVGATKHRTRVRIFPLARGVIAEAGVLGLWKGTGPSVARFCIGAGIYISFVDVLQGLTTDKSATTAFMCGAGARAAACVLSLPLTVTKTRLEALKAHEYRNTASAVRHILRTERIPGLYRGMSATLARDVPSSAIYLAIYESMHARWKVWRNLDPGSARGPLETFGIGFIAATVTTTVTNPFDVAKTRVQVCVVQGNILLVGRYVNSFGVLNKEFPL